MVVRALAIEDGNLNQASIITSRKVDYKDIDLTFQSKPSGEIYKKTDAAAVKQAVKNVLLTNPGEKPFKPYFGGGLGALLFELIDADAEEELTDAINIAIENYEPRAKILSTDINVAPSQNSIAVTVTFQIKNTTETVVLETTLLRTR